MTPSRHFAIWLLPTGPLDVFGAGPTQCGDLDGPGAPRCALHVTLATFDAPRTTAQAQLARARARLPAQLEAAVLPVATSALARMRTYLPLHCATDPRALIAPNASAATADVPLHISLSYVAEHATARARLDSITLGPLALVDLGQPFALDPAQWVIVATAP